MNNRPTILLVEDDDELRRLYEIRLKKADYNVIMARDGDEAVLKGLTEKPDFILLDLMLPKKGGIQVMRILKSNIQTRDIPILVLTAYDSFDYRKDTQAHSLNYMLKTETTPQKIVEMIDAYFEKGK